MMRRQIVRIGLALVFVGMPAALDAQAPSCPEALAVHREVLARLLAERARGEVEVATELARLKAGLERVTNERDAARAKLKELAPR